MTLTKIILLLYGLTGLAIGLQKYRHKYCEYRIPLQGAIIFFFFWLLIYIGRLIKYIIIGRGGYFKIIMRYLVFGIPLYAGTIYILLQNSNQLLNFVIAVIFYNLIWLIIWHVEQKDIKRRLAKR